MLNENDAVLNLIFKISDKLVYEVDKNGIVTILEKQDNKIQRFFRKLGMKIPKYKRTAMDEYGSSVFLQIDGSRTVCEIGKSLEEKYGDKVEPLYERLLLFISHLEQQFHYIENISTAVPLAGEEHQS
ncbi:MAG: PqqD family peptide modification chaperone [Lachnospiraceae bacterium]